MATRQFELGLIETYHLISSIEQISNANKITKQADAIYIFLKAEEMMNATQWKKMEAFKFEFEILASKLCGSRANQELKE